MGDQHAAPASGASPRFERDHVALAHQAFLSGDRIGVRHVVRDEVLASWERSLQHVVPHLDHAPVHDDAPTRWRSGPMAQAFRTVEDEVAQIAHDGDFVAAVTDETGAIVWVAGGRTMRRRAEEVAFLPGGRWDEAAVGTNALALALTSGRPWAVRATEHFSPMVQDWVCYSAPIRDPVTGSPVGVLDLSTTFRRANPLALSTVTALARNLELVLEARGGVQPPVEASTLRLEVLGRGDVSIDGARVALPPRQVELLTLLAIHPGGLTLEALHDRLHGDRPANPNTTKAELSHLRRSVGSHLGNRPYRLDGSWTCDHAEVLDALRLGRVDDALVRYGGTLLPRSASPCIEEHRHALDVALRSAVLADPTPARVTSLLAVMPDDPYLIELAAALARR
ncbi:MAG: hypothetical protein U0Q03_14580 [Acidimicrobiales bacterium]